jgi:hypothetical protein
VKESGLNGMRKWNARLVYTMLSISLFTYSETELQKLWCGIFVKLTFKKCSTFCFDKKSSLKFILDFLYHNTEHGSLNNFFGVTPYFSVNISNWSIIYKPFSSCILQAIQNID